MEDKEVEKIAVRLMKLFMLIGFIVSLPIICGIGLVLFPIVLIMYLNEKVEEYL